MVRLDESPLLVAYSATLSEAQSLKVLNVGHFGHVGHISNTGHFSATSHVRTLALLVYLCMLASNVFSSCEYRTNNKLIVMKNVIKLIN